MPVTGLLAPGYLARLAELAEPGGNRRAAARPDPWQWQDGPARPFAPGGAVSDAHTTHFCVIDRDGGAVSMTQWLIDDFGSCVVVPGTGILLNSAMHNFDPRPGRLASIGPGRRSVHHGSPLVVTDADRGLRIVVGGAGGTRIVTGLSQVLVNVLARGMDMQTAVTAPRVHDEAGAVSEADVRIGHTALDELARRHHRVAAYKAAFAAPVAARINGIEVTRDGLRGAGVDPYVPSGAAWTNSPEPTSA